MLTPSRSLRASASCPAIRLPSSAFDRIDHRRGAQRGNNVREMPQILHLDIHEDLEEIERAVGDLQIGDIAAALADHSGQATEASRLVAQCDIDAPDMRADGRIVIPGNI